MDLKEYQKAALRTESKVDKLEFNTHFVGLLLKLFAINGQILDAIKKEVYYKNSKKANETIVSNLEQIGKLATAAKASFYVDHIKRDVVDINPRLFHGIIGVATESGELVESLLNTLDGNDVDVINLQEEIGDLAWYIAILHDTYGLDGNETLSKNINKLRNRYPEKFTVENAEQRKLDEERKILEGNNG